eukprot:Rhum_TRINITY_DN9002_c0_g1::Rhum_TRINITY_DN9002_c0_g1_i1::g.31059::m.31059
MMRWLGVLVTLAALQIPKAEGSDALLKHPFLKCSACKAVVVELLKRKEKKCEENQHAVQVSHRLGNGKFDPHGAGGVKKMTYANSELMAIDVMEDLCDTAMGMYRLKLNETDNTRMFADDHSLPAGESYNKQDKDVASDAAKELKKVCHEILELHDEVVEEKLRASTGVVPDLIQQICVSGTRLCKNEGALKIHELKNRDAAEARKAKKIDKTRKEGTSQSFQVADLHFRLQADVLNLTELNATGGSESGDHPHAEGPTNIVDSNPATKCLDYKKQALFVEFASDVTIDSYTYTTANDFPERDPVRWRLYGLVEEVVAADEAAPAVDAEGTPAAEAGASADATDKEGEGEAEAPKPLVKETWTLLHEVVTPHPVPHNRSVQLEWFSIATATHRKFKFDPVAKKAKKKKRVSKEAAGEGTKTAESSDPTKPDEL